MFSSKTSIQGYWSNTIRDIYHGAYIIIRPYKDKVIYAFIIGDIFTIFLKVWNIRN